MNYLLLKTRGIKPPLEVAMQRFDWRNGWNDLWISTPEGNAYLQTLHHYRVKLNRHGTFRISGLPAGEYEFAFKIYGRTPDRSVRSVGTKVVRFNVTDGTSGQDPVDLGIIEIEAASSHEPGKSASDFEIQLLDASVP
ncbi:MAG: hypothetical protein ACREHD_32720 [Pirellulales bacterium]